MTEVARARTAVVMVKRILDNDYDENSTFCGIDCATDR